MSIIENIFNNRDRTDNSVIKQRVKCLGPFEFKVIHIVGTNGKGSVSHYLTTNLMKKYKVGTFTSPHIFRANERIKVNNKEIPTKALESLIQKNKNLHFFAIMYLSALAYFKAQKCDVVIIEAGIGGRFDTTNTLPGSIGVLTSVGLDHTELLGKSKEEILYDKLGIMNSGMNFYTGSEIKEYEDIINDECLKVNSKHFQVDNNKANYKLRNQSLVKFILKKEFNIKATFVEPLGRTSMQVINNTKAFIDVAHNKDGIQATLEYLNSIHETFDQVVITISKKKDWKKIETLFHNKKIFVYKLDENFISAKDLNVDKVDNIKLFYKKQNKNTLYIGSFFSVGKILNRE